MFNNFILAFAYIVLLWEKQVLISTY